MSSHSLFSPPNHMLPLYMGIWHDFPPCPLTRMLDNRTHHIQSSIFRVTLRWGISTALAVAGAMGCYKNYRLGRKVESTCDRSLAKDSSRALRRNDCSLRRVTFSFLFGGSKVFQAFRWFRSRIYDCVMGLLAEKRRMKEKEKGI